MIWRGGRNMACISQLCDTLDVICPMHVVVDKSGHVVHVGPTLQKLRADTPMAGMRFLELFELTRPRNIETFQDLMEGRGGSLRLKFRDEPRTALKGVLAPSMIEDGAIINLSFGISILDGVRDYALTSADFAATDLTIEMLYLVEAKSAAMEASRKLNLRLQSSMIAAEEQAFTDTLTGLKNRRAVDHILPRLIEREHRFAVLQLDLDFFKAVNDTQGHAAGDHVLQHVAKILVEETRSSDTVARVGGDEFVLILDRMKDPSVLAGICTRMIERIEAPIPFKDVQCQISGSIGVALSSPPEARDMSQLLADADVALYASKHRGRACFTVFDPEIHGKDGAPSDLSDGHSNESGAA